MALVKWIKKRARLLAQIGFAAITNGYFPGFARGTIYKGNSKAVCVPGLNCYSCPGALGSCPIGALQATLGDRNYHFAFYVVGFLLVVGAVLGTGTDGFVAIPTLGGILVAFCVSVGVGILFGYLPANKAAKLNPIDALRYD